MNTTTKTGFTLAETLITLVIVGVIAALTIPNMIANYQEKVLTTRLKQTYSIFLQAMYMAKKDNGSPNTWDIGQSTTSDGALKLYAFLKPYLKEIKDCKTSGGCFASNYEALFNKNLASNWLVDEAAYYANGVLANGTSFSFWSNGTGCPNDYCGDIAVDLNGKAKPNKAGVDHFYFHISPRGLELSGQFDNGQNLICKYNDTNNITVLDVPIGL